MPQTYQHLGVFSDWVQGAREQQPLSDCALSPLLVPYDLDDKLFTQQGMRNADARLKEQYASAGNPAAYVGQFYPGPHKFDLEMQTAAFAWPKQSLT